MRPKGKIVLIASVVALLFWFATGYSSPVHVPTPPEDNLLATAYGGGETLRYSVSWMGITAGELAMKVTRLENSKQSFAIAVTARSAGLLAVFYPVEDSFLTIVEGRLRLPLRHEMQQKEGRRQNSRVTIYDQKSFRISSRKNEEPPEVHQVAGPVHNEFSSFFFLRVLPFTGNGPLIVPTFADKKRHEVVVSLEGRETLETVLGPRKTVKARPRLNFKGLYEKMGDPQVWLTDDDLRIPVRIQAKIVIGSLTADLVEYSGPSPSAPAPGM